MKAITCSTLLALTFGASVAMAQQTTQTSKTPVLLPQGTLDRLAVSKPAPPLPVAFNPLPSFFTYRGLSVQSGYQNVDVSGFDASTTSIFLRLGSELEIGVSSASQSLTPGAYTVGVDVVTTGNVQPVAIAIYQGNAVSSVRIASCPLVLGAQRCIGVGTAGSGLNALHWIVKIESTGSTANRNAAASAFKKLLLGLP